MLLSSTQDNDDLSDLEFEEDDESGNEEEVNPQMIHVFGMLNR